MADFQQHYWGYEITYPDDWTHATHGEVEAFAMHRQALDSAYDGPHMGYLLIRAEYNPYQKPIQPVWAQHLAKIGVMHAAKKVGSAPFEVGVLQGFEAELVLPQRDNRRLWVGILAAGSIILHLMVTHRKTEKDTFQPIFSQMVASLRFAGQVADVTQTPGGMPLPREAEPAAIEDVYPHHDDASRWEAYHCAAAADALQIFYAREAPVHGWELLALDPYPNQDEKKTWASLIVHKTGQGAAIHILPKAQGSDLIIQYHQT